MLVVSAFGVAACSSGDDTSGAPATTASGAVADAPADAPAEVPTTGPARGDAAPVEVGQVPASPTEDVPSALVAALGGDVDGLPTPLVPLDELRSGGPPPDGIPPIDEPVFVRAGSVDFLDDSEPVLALDVDGDSRAYPVQVMIWHEIVNDTVGGVPVAVTYCPLCNSALAYDRRIGERVVTFGTSGLLWNSALVMYDRQTGSLWSHFTGEAIAGVLTGTELGAFPVATVPWGAWRDAHPDGIVLGRDTGFVRDYGVNPYPGYDDLESEPFLFEGEVDGRFTAMTRIVGVEGVDGAVGVPLVTLREQRVVRVELDGAPLVVWWQPGTSSALDADDIAGGDDVGSTGAFVPVVDGQVLSFVATQGGFVDDRTGSTWDLFGRATAGPLAGRQLEQVPHVDTFWFAWSTFRPDTAVYSGQ